MGSFRSLCVLIVFFFFGFYGSLCFFMVFDGSLWVLMGPSKSLCVDMGSNGSLWVLIGLYSS